MQAIINAIRRFSLSDYYAPIVFLAVYGLVIGEAYVAAICALLVLECILCLFCEDLVPMLLPLTLLFCLFCLCQEGSATLLGPMWLIWFAIPCGGILIYRLLRDLRHVRLGAAFPPLVFVSVALILGGLGTITAEEYFSTASLYHVLGLGPLLVFLYLFFKSNARVPRRYDLGDRFSAAMYLGALFLGFLILRAYVMNLDVLYAGGSLSDIALRHILWRNIAANLMVMLLPFVFYYARRHSLWHTPVAVLLYLVVALSGSRGALVCGAIILLLGFIYLAIGRPRVWLVLLALLLVLGLLLFANLERFEALYDQFFGFHHVDGDDAPGTPPGQDDVDFDIRNESRFALMKRALRDFLAAPVFGQGLGDTANGDMLYLNAFRIGWYHSLLPQILGSLGLFGLLAYGWQFLVRLRLILRGRRTAFCGALTLSYAGLLLYSQIDPGLFSPFPYAVLCVLLVVMLEEQAGEAGRLTRRRKAKNKKATASD